LIVVDTSAIMAIVLAEDDADNLLTVVSNADEAFMAAPSVLELEIVLRAKTGSRGRSATQLLSELAISIVPFSADHLDEAIAAFSRFGRGRHPAGLNFGDCFSYALAKSLGAALLFKGDDFSQTDIIPAMPASLPPATPAP
jgi:ribonuclease VapC